MIAVLPPLRRRATLPDLGSWGVVLLALWVAAATAWAVMAADWADGTGVALLTTCAAVAEAALVARSTAGRLLALVVAPLLGAMVVIPLTLGGMPDDGGEGLRHVLERYGQQLVTGLFSDQNWEFVVGLCGIFWAVGFWTGWMAVRERRPVLALLPCFAVLAVNVLNAPSLQHVAVPEVAAVTGALLLLARVHAAALSWTWRRNRVIALPGTESRCARVGMAAALPVLVIALLLPPVSTRDVSGYFFHTGGGGGGGGSGGSGTRIATGGGATVRFSPDTVLGGPLRNQPVQVISYSTDSTETLYLRVVNDTDFSDGAWHPDAQVRAMTMPAGSIARDPAAQADAQHPVRATFVLGIDATGLDALTPFLGEPSAVDAPGTAFGEVTPSTSFGADGNPPALLTVDSYIRDGGLHNGVTVTTTAMVSDATTTQLRAAGTAYPDWVQQYTRLPTPDPAGAQQVDELKAVADRWIGDASARNPYDIATAIERHLRTTVDSHVSSGPIFTYTLTPPAPAQGVWPVTDFVLRTHAGYCQYFASAMGIMLRAEGIPTRLVAGYGPGSTTDSRGIATGKVHNVTSSDAHVWVEAYFPRYGWIPFEPTPSSDAGGQYDQFARGGEAQTPPGTTPSSSAAPTAAATPKPTPTPRPTVASAATDTAGGVPPALIGIAVVAAAALLLATVLHWLARPRTPSAAWSRLRVVGRVLGVRRQPSETHLGYARRLAHTLPPDTTTVLHRDGSALPGPRPARARVTQLLEEVAGAASRDAFAQRPLNEREQVQWRRAWWRLQRFLPLLLWRSILARTAR